MSERITDAGLTEVETGLRKYEAEDGPLERARVSAKLALQFVAEVRRLRGLIVCLASNEVPAKALVQLHLEARAIREESTKA